MFKRPIWLTGVLLSGLTALPAFGEGVVPDQLFQQAAAAGDVQVLIELNTTASAAGNLSGQNQSAGPAAIAEAQQQVLNALKIPGAAAAAAAGRGHGVKLMQYSPYMALPATKEMLDVLQNHPQVKSVMPDGLSAPNGGPVLVPPDGSSAMPAPPSLSSSVPKIGADIAQQYGINGNGQTVAVLDTGVQKTHPFLSGKVVSEACYSTTNSIASSVCPGGVAESTATGSGVNCDLSISGCQHGTHVAGIAAGKGGGSTGVTYSGVAPEAEVIAIQVFSRFSGTNCTSFGLSSPCALSYDSDQLKGLERVYALRNSHEIAAANMSLGGGRYFSYCNSDPRYSIINNLRDAGIATVVSSGNSYYRDSVGAPACVQPAVTVGATDDSDNVASFSNIDDTVDFLAPGVNVTSSVPTSGGSGYATWDGTSMSAPHVAGTFALFGQFDSIASVSEVESRLVDTSVQVDDDRSGGIQDDMDRILLAWMGNDRCYAVGKIVNRWSYTSATPYGYIGVQPDANSGNSFVYLARIQTGTSLSDMVNTAIGRAANLGKEPTVTVRGSAPCPTSGTLRNIYSADYGFLTNND